MGGLLNAILRDPKTSPEELANIFSIATDLEDTEIMTLIVQHPNNNSETLMYATNIAKNNLDLNLISAIAQNRNTPNEGLWSLAQASIQLRKFKIFEDNSEIDNVCQIISNAIHSRVRSPMISDEELFCLIEAAFDLENPYLIIDIVRNPTISHTRLLHIFNNISSRTMVDIAPAECIRILHDIQYHQNATPELAQCCIKNIEQITMIICQRQTNPAQEFAALPIPLAIPQRTSISRTTSTAEDVRPERLAQNTYVGKLEADNRSKSCTIL